MCNCLVTCWMPSTRSWRREPTWLPGRRTTPRRRSWTRPCDGAETPAAWRRTGRVARYRPRGEAPAPARHPGRCCCGPGMAVLGSPDSRSFHAVAGETTVAGGPFELGQDHLSAADLRGSDD